MLKSEDGRLVLLEAADRTGFWGGTLSYTPSPTLCRVDREELDPVPNEDLCEGLRLPST